MFKNLSICVLAAATALSVVGCKKTPKSDQEKVSYAIGQQIGRNIKMQNIDVDMKMMAQAVEEAVKGEESKMTPQEMQQAMMKMQKDRMESRKKEAEQNVGKGKEFLEKNKSKDGVKITESGLQYKVMKAGEGPSPKASDTVKVHYKGTLLDGTEFDSSYKRKAPAEFPVGGVIKGWTEALKLMKVGGKWELFIPAELAYGEMGRPSIPPNSVLVFEVELMEIVDKNAKKEAPKAAVPAKKADKKK